MGLGFNMKTNIQPVVHSVVDSGLLTIIGQIHNPLRHFMQMAMSDAVVSFSSEAVGIFSNLPRVSMVRLSVDEQNTLMNTASVYAAYAFCALHVTASLPSLEAFMKTLGLKIYKSIPVGASNLEKAIANGYVAGNAAAEYWSRAGTLVY